MTDAEIPVEAAVAFAETLRESGWKKTASRLTLDASRPSVRDRYIREAAELLAAALPHLRVQETRAYEWSAAIRRRGKVDRFGVTFCDDESEYAKRFALDEMYDGERSGQEGEEFVLMRRSIGEWEVTGRE